ncbi:hypothetical protein [Maribacter litoralis]|uniref:hypothetical protein n=1 Tax=Maribacter litoralis TaxID=2059726 RepID=UPI003F5CC259
MKSKIFIGIFVIVTFSCNNNDDLSDNENFLFWNQTKCGDPWNTGENNSIDETEVAVTQYLESENIVFTSLGFDNNSPLDTLCESCDCGTGQRIIIGTNVSDISKLENLGFYQ